MELVEKFLDLTKKHIKVGIVGDSMLDEYFYVHVNRISPEFPIPVMLSNNQTTTHQLPGGAANTAYQFTHFNTTTQFIGLLNLEVSNVYYGKFGMDYCLFSEEFKVPKKRRFYHEDHPLCRWDIEEKYYGLEKEILKKELEKIIIPNNFDVLIFSDYGKGIFSSPWVNCFHSCPTIVDPKDDLSLWTGCTILKPNSIEAKKLSGSDNWQEQCKILIEKTKCSAVVITQGKDGVVGYADGKYFDYRSSKSEIARSVIGAGDCFTAFLAMGIGRGMPVYETVQIAYEAGALYVKNKHNEPITPLQLRRYTNCKKIVDFKDLLNRDFKLVFTNGCFDIFHIGHLETLKFAKGKGEALVVAVNDDESVRRLKGDGRPVNGLMDRMRLLAGLEFVDYVVSFSEDTPLRVIEAMRPDVLVKGGDYNPKELIGNELVKEVYIAPYVSGFSTTSYLARRTF